MGKINDSITALKNRMLDTLSKESSKEQIDFVNQINGELDSIESEANKIVDEKREITDLYVKATKSAGSKDVVDDGSGDSEGKTLEQCLSEELAKKTS